METVRNANLDERDQEILTHRLERWHARSGPRVGDFIEMLDGTTRRFTHDHGKHGLQTTYIWKRGADAGKSADASFYLCADGTMSFSGSLDNAIPPERIRDKEEFRDGNAWFFHHDIAKAHSGVHFSVQCRVYRQLDDGIPVDAFEAWNAEQDRLDKEMSKEPLITKKELGKAKARKAFNAAGRAIMDGATPDEAMAAARKEIDR